MCHVEKIDEIRKQNAKGTTKQKYKNVENIQRQNEQK